MYLYQVGYGTHEESHYFEFRHRLKFTQNEFLNIVATALEEASIVYARDDIKSELDCFKSESVKLNTCSVNMQTLMHTSEFFGGMTKRGFKSVNYEVCVDFNGWSSVFGSDDNNDDWKIDEDQQKTHKRIRKTLAREGIEFGISATVKALRDEKERKEKENENE